MSNFMNRITNAMSPQLNTFRIFPEYPFPAPQVLPQGASKNTKSSSIHPPNIRVFPLLDPNFRLLPREQRRGATTSRLGTTRSSTRVPPVVLLSKLDPPEDDFDFWELGLQQPGRQVVGQPLWSEAVELDRGVVCSVGSSVVMGC